MAFRWIVNAGLIAIPIGSTLGVLFGIDASRHAAGQAPLFSPGSGAGTPGSSGPGGSPGDSTGGGGAGTHTTNNELGVTLSQYCELTHGVEPPAIDGQVYAINPNQWGVLAADGPDAPSGMCVNVTTFINATYPTNITAPQWSATWKYTPFPGTQPVHAYPNIQIAKGLPIVLSDVRALNFDMAWTYALGNETKDTSDTPEFNSVSLNTNVAIDMFFDSDKNNAVNSSMAKHEIMVWFAHYGDAAQSIGNATGIVESKVVNQTTFDLYHGSHTVGENILQNVFTWVAHTDVKSFTGDLWPLISELTSKTGSQYPSETDYMGSFGFGSEAYYADNWVTFYVPKLQVDLQT